jgi:hypothetical protein
MPSVGGAPGEIRRNASATGLFAAEAPKSDGIPAGKQFFRDQVLPYIRTSGRLAGLVQPPEKQNLLEPERLCSV